MSVKHKFVRAKGLSAWMIGRQGMQWGGFSHVAALLPNGTLFDSRADKQLCVDGVKRSGVQNRPDDYEEWPYYVVVEIPHTELLTAAWQDKLFSKKGDTYDMDSIYGFIFGQPLHKRGTFICSALQTWACKQIELMHSGHLALTKSSGVDPDALFLIDTIGLGGTIIEARGMDLNLQGGSFQTSPH